MKNVLVVNPKNGQPLEVSEKAFNSVYRDKGFEIVDRDNADKVSAARPGRRLSGENVGKGNRVTGRETPADNAGSGVGDASTVSAADIAKTIGLTGQEGTAETTTGGAKANEGKTNTNKPATAERNSAKRDRGRRK